MEKTSTRRVLFKITGVLKKTSKGEKSGILIEIKKLYETLKCHFVKQYSFLNTIK